MLIYFNPSMQRMALETFGLSLRDGGRLVLGPSETVASMPGPYAEEHARLRIYRRVGDPPRLPLSMAKPLRPHRDLEAPLETAIRATRRDVQLAADSTEAAEALLLDLGLGLVVVDARYYIIRINTAARRMLGIHGLAFDQDFIHLAESLPSDPDPDRHRCRNRRQDDESRTRDRVARGRDRRRPLPRDVVVRPYIRQAGTIEGAVIELTDVSAAERDRAAGERSERQLERATVVNRRLLRANDELTALVAQLRIANQSMLQSSEEAQSGREEVETLNEEFQATNEELETLNEELTASVEELRVANEDLAARTDELRLQTVGARGAEAPRRGGAQPPPVGPRQPRRCGRRGRPRGRDARDEPGLRPAVRRAPTPRSSPRTWPGCRSRRPSGRSSGRRAARRSGWSSRSAIRTAAVAGSRP